MARPTIVGVTLAALGVPAEEAVHVGDDATLDVAGAQTAGLRVIQVVASGREAATTPAPDLVIEGLGALLEAIEALERRLQTRELLDALREGRLMPRLGGAPWGPRG